MSQAKKPLGITDVVLRDAHQSLFATRMRIDDMLPIAEKLDKVGFYILDVAPEAVWKETGKHAGSSPVCNRLSDIPRSQKKCPPQPLPFMRE